MELKEFIQKLKDFNKFHLVATRQVSTSALSIVKSRIQLHGLDGEVYSDFYANTPEFKRIGKNKGVVDLTLTGRMMKEVKITSVEIKSGKIEVKVGVSSENDKFRKNQKRYGNFLKLNKQEISIIENSFEKLYERELNRLFG